MITEEYKQLGRISITHPLAALLAGLRKMNWRGGFEAV